MSNFFDVIQSIFDGIQNVFNAGFVGVRDVLDTFEGFSS